MSIELENITRVVDGQFHIYETDLKLEAGAFNILLGTTLSGKTTLMRLMAGLDKPSSGRVLFDGQDVTRVPVRKRNIAMVYQAFINYPGFSVYENIASPLKVAGVQKDEIHERVQGIAELLKLEPMLERDVSQLSGGQQQRTALARALVKNAPLVLLDEPLANLDYKLREELRDELPRLFENSGSTVVYATSEPEEALLLGGHTATLQEGRVVQFGRTIEVYRKPQTLNCARVFSDPPVNQARVTKNGGVIDMDGIARWECPTTMKSQPDGQYMLAVRPHHLTLDAGEGHHVALDGEVQITEISGSQSLIHMEMSGNNWISESGGVHPFKVNDAARVYLQLDHCLYFHSDGQAIDSARPN